MSRDIRLDDQSWIVKMMKNPVKPEWKKREKLDYVELR